MSVVKVDTVSPDKIDLFSDRCDLISLICLLHYMSVTSQLTSRWNGQVIERDETYWVFARFPIVATSILSKVAGPTVLKLRDRTHRSDATSVDAIYSNQVVIAFGTVRKLLLSRLFDNLYFIFFCFVKCFVLLEIDRVGWPFHELLLKPIHLVWTTDEERDFMTRKLYCFSCFLDILYGEYSICIIYLVFDNIMVLNFQSVLCFWDIIRCIIFFKWRKALYPQTLSSFLR